MSVPVTVVTTPKVSTPVVIQQAQQTGKFDERAFSGRWFQIARYGTHNDIFTEPVIIKWIFTNNRPDYFSIQIELDYSEDAVVNMANPRITSRSIVTGYSTSIDDELNIFLHLPTGIYSIGRYNIYYTDYINYALIGNRGDLFLFTRRPTLDNSDIPILLLLAEQHGYDASKININAKVASSIVNMVDPVRVTLTDRVPFISSISPSPSKSSEKITLDTLVEPEVSKSAPKKAQKRSKSNKKTESLTTTIRHSPNTVLVPIDAKLIKVNESCPVRYNSKKKQ